MRVKRKSARTLREQRLAKIRQKDNQNENSETPPSAQVTENRSNQEAGPSRSHLNVMSGPVNQDPLHEQSDNSSSESEMDYNPLHFGRYHGSSQQAGPSNAGPIIIGSHVNQGRQSMQSRRSSVDSSATEIISESEINEPIFLGNENANFGAIMPPEDENNFDQQLNDSFNMPLFLDPLIRPATDQYSRSWLTAAKNFDKIMSEIRWNSCSRCEQSFPDLSLQNNICRLCTNKRTHSLFFDNNMQPGDIPEQLIDLTPVEEMLIARIHPVVCFYRIKGQQIGYSGHVIHFKQDVLHLHSKLPVNPLSSQAFIIVARTTPSGVANLRVRSEKIKNALEWLKANHQYYNDIEIDYELIASLPFDDNLELPSMNVRDETEDDGQNADNLITESNFPNIPQLDQSQAINNALSNVIEWPDVENIPINEFCTEGYLTQAFPTLFPYGQAGLRQPRLHKISHVDYFQYLMRFRDQRFARNPRFRFVAFDSIMRWSALSQGNILVQKGALQGMNANELGDRLNSDPALASKCMFYVGKLRASQSYWSQRCGELLDMVQQLGTPTIFFTLSAADYHWPDLFRLLKPDSTPENLSEAERARLMHENPLITSWFFRRRAETFFNNVMKKIYPIRDFWYRYEWQWRGSPHIHGVLWLENAPDISNLDILNQEQRDSIASYFANFCSAWNPMEQLPASSTHPSRSTFTEKINDEFDLTHLLNCFQRHTRCGRHCMREDRRTKRVKCRFGFPKDLRDNDAIIKEDGNWTFKPRRNDEKMARYNRFITQVWRGNTDFSPITSKEAVLNYIARYASKCEHASEVHKKTLADLVDSSSPETPAKTLINKLLMSSTAERDFSAQEVAHLMMSWPLFHSSRSYVNICVRDARWVRLFDEQAADDAAIVTRYKSRTADLQHLSLYEFARKFQFRSGQPVLRRKEAIVRIFPRLKLGVTAQEKENYYKLMATVFLPWSDAPETLVENINTPRPYETICQSLPANLPIHVEYPLPEDLFDDDLPPDPVREVRDIEMAVSRAVPALGEIHPLGQREIDEEYNWENHTVSEIEANNIEIWMERERNSFQRNSQGDFNQVRLSPDQQVVFDLFRNQVEQILNRETVEFKRVMVQGKAGCGKSFVIARISSYCRRLLGNNAVALLAPTGVAAININGKTIHSFLQISIQKTNPLTGEALRKFQLKMKDVKIIIFDEMSMIGLKLLAQISDRLREGKAVNEPFGGLVVYFFGDMQQLPPVLDHPWYSEREKAVASRGKLISETIQKYLLLSVSHRQSGADQSAFRNLLDSIANGCVSTDQYNLLMTRRQSILPRVEIAGFANCISIFPTRQQVKMHNEEFLRKTNNPVARIPAQNNAPQAIIASSHLAQGLARELYLAIGCKVMLRVNLWTEVGLVNGAVGFVRDICYKEGQRPPEMPVAIMVEFENYTGPCYRHNLVPIKPIKRHWSVGENSFWRLQLPINLAHAITVHKSQGLTLDKVVVNIGDTEKTLGQSYVALSRVKTLQGLMLSSSFEKSRLDNISNSPNFVARRRFLQRFS